MPPTHTVIVELRRLVFVSSSSKSRRQNATVMNYCNCDLPGYYYDVSRKKYFHVYPGFRPPAPLESELSSTHEAHGRKIAKNNEIGSHRCELRKLWWRKVSNQNTATHLVSLLNGRELGCLNSTSSYRNVYFQQEVVKTKLQKMPENASDRLFRVSAMHQTNPNLSMLTCVRLLPSKTKNKIFAFWRYTSKYKIDGSVFAGSFKARTPPRNESLSNDVESFSPISISQSIRYRCNLLGKVTDACWAESLEGQENAMACVVSDSSEVPNFCFLFRKPDDVQTLMINPAAMFSCAFNCAHQRYAIGLERHGCFGELSDPCKRTLLYSCKSSVLNMKFLNDSGNVLLSALRNGHLCCSDLRDKPSSRYTYRTRLGTSSVNQLVVMRNDENYILASGHNHTLVKFDLRSRRIVQHYKEYSNRDRCIPFYVDEEADVLCSMGDDEHARLWRLTNGKLIVKLPSPHLSQVKDGGPVLSLPQCCFKMNWGDFGNCPALLWTIQENRNYVSYV